MTEERLWDFIRTWEQPDMDALMSYIHDDCIYITTTGAGPGSVYESKTAVYEGFVAVLADDDGTTATMFGPLFIAGNRGTLEWTVCEADRVVMRGCDLFVFDGDLVIRKDAFRKVVP